MENIFDSFEFYRTYSTYTTHKPYGKYYNLQKNMTEHFELSASYYICAGKFTKIAMHIRYENVYPCIDTMFININSKLAHISGYKIQRKHFCNEDRI